MKLTYIDKFNNKKGIKIIHGIKFNFITLFKCVLYLNQVEQTDH